MLSPLSKHFENGDIRFLTLRGHKPREQKLDFAIKMIKKVSATFVLVRERNHRKEGYHFHALLKMKSLPKKAWFKKGLHVNLQVVGGRKLPSYPLTFTGHEQMSLPIDAKTTAKMNDYVSVELTARVVLKHADTVCRNPHVIRCLHYMSKDLDMPIQYYDYVVQLKGKNYPLTPPKVTPLPSGRTPCPRPGGRGLP